MMKPVIDKVVGGVLLAGFLAGMVGYGGGKTNSVPPNLNAPFAPMGEMHPLQGLARSIWPDAFEPRILSHPLPMPDAEKMASNWNARGAWRDSFRLDFDQGWVFPWRTNHLTSVEVLSHGEIRPQWNDTNAVARLGAPVSIVPGLTTFAYEFTPSNSYRFVWTDAAVNRDTNNLMTASIELMRCGDVAVTTNGVAALLPRELPFAHDGFGQDAEWVAANFTNATEIAAAGGYAAWVDAQVGEGLTNGLYKLTVDVTDDPPETVNLAIGDLSVAITNAGEYVFLLGKGVRYDVSASSDCATNFVYSAVDDIPATPRQNEPGMLLLGGGSPSDGKWVADLPRLMLPPLCNYVLFEPNLAVIPGEWHPSWLSPAKTFTAILTDLPPFAPPPEFAWTSHGSANVSISSPAGATTSISCAFPDSFGSSASLQLDVAMGAVALRANFCCEIEQYNVGDYDNLPPEGIAEDDWTLGLSIGASPGVVFFERGSVNSETVDLACRYRTAAGGTFTLTYSGDSCDVVDGSFHAVSSGHTWEIDEACEGVRHFTVSHPFCSSSPSGTVFAVAFEPYSGTNVMAESTSVVFVEWETRTVETWPGDRHRKELGVGEKVDINFLPTIPFSSVYSSVSSGGITPNGNANYQYTAPTNACNDEVVFTALTGDCCPIPFSILEPTGSIVVNVASNLENHLNIAGTFEIYFDLVLAPTNVSFKNRIEVAEIGGVAANATGYFSSPSLAGLLDHGQHGAARWVKIEDENFAGMDTIGPGALYPPFSDGSFTWPIPNHWRMVGDSGVGKWFCNNDQHFAITTNGTTSVWKFGKRGTRMLNSDTVTITNEEIP